MHKKLKKLSQAIKEQNKEEALTIYLKSLRGNVPNNELVTNIFHDILPTLYRNSYIKVPHGFMGLLAANFIEKYLDKYPGLAISQAIWYLADENKLAPLDFSVFTPALDENKLDFNIFENYVNEGNIAKAYKVFLALKEKSKDYADLFKETFNIAYKDTINSGHKAIYNMMMFDNISSLGNIPDHIFFPSISYMASEPKDFGCYQVALEEYNKVKSKRLEYYQNTLELSDDDSDLLINLIIYGVKSKLFAYINKLLNQGISIQSILDNITIASSRILLITDYYEWTKPIHAFNYSYSINWWNRSFNHSEGLLSVYLLSTYLNKTSIDHKKVDFDGSTVYAPQKNIIENIIQSIIISNISDTVCLTKSYLLSGGDIDFLIKKLIDLAVINDPINNFMHDIKICYTSIKEYNANTSQHKYLILVALAKHLSQSEKNYDSFKLYKSILKV